MADALTRTCPGRLALHRAVPLSRGASGHVAVGPDIGACLALPNGGHLARGRPFVVGLLLNGGWSGVPCRRDGECRHVRHAVRAILRSLPGLMCGFGRGVGTAPARVMLTTPLGNLQREMMTPRA